MDDWFLCSIGLMVLLSVHFLIDILCRHGGCSIHAGIVRFLDVATLCFPALVVLVAILYSLELYEGTASVVTAGRSAASAVGMAVAVGGAYGCAALMRNERLHGGHQAACIYAAASRHMRWA